jgi:hypothetical protein
MAKLEGMVDAFESYKANYISDKGTERGLLETWRAETGKPKEASGAPNAGAAKVGSIIQVGGKTYRIVGGDPNDPDVEEVK